MKSATCTAWADALERAVAERPIDPPAVGRKWRSLETFDERVEHIADLLATGKWSGRASAKKLAEAWKVRIGTVQDYARAASLLARTDRGSREQAREESLGHWGRLHKLATACGDYKAAATAQTGWDKAAGVVDSGGAKVINVIQLPGVQTFMRSVTAALDAEGGEQLRLRVVARVRAAMGGGAAYVNGGPPVIDAKVEPPALEEHVDEPHDAAPTVIDPQREPEDPERA